MNEFTILNETAAERERLLAPPSGEVERFLETQFHPYRLFILRGLRRRANRQNTLSRLAELQQINHDFLGRPPSRAFVVADYIKEHLFFSAISLAARAREQGLTPDYTCWSDVAIGARNVTENIMLAELANMDLDAFKKGANQAARNASPTLLGQIDTYHRLITEGLEGSLLMKLDSSGITLARIYLREVEEGINPDNKLPRLLSYQSLELIARGGELAAIVIGLVINISKPLHFVGDP